MHNTIKKNNFYPKILNKKKKSQIRDINQNIN